MQDAGKRMLRCVNWRRRHLLQTNIFPHEMNNSTPRNASVEVFDAITDLPIPPDRVLIIDGAHVDMETLLINATFNDNITNPFNRQPFEPKTLAKLDAYKSRQMIPILVRNFLAPTLSKRAQFVLLRDYFCTVGDIIVDCASKLKRLNEILKLDIRLVLNSNLVSCFDLDPTLRIDSYIQSAEDRQICLVISQGPNTRDTKRFENFIACNDRHERVVKALQPNDQTRSDVMMLLAMMLEDTYRRPPPRTAVRRQPRRVESRLVWYPQARTADGSFIWDVTFDTASIAPLVVRDYDWSAIPFALASGIEYYNLYGTQEIYPRHCLLNHPNISTNVKEKLQDTTSPGIGLPNPRCVTRHPQILRRIDATYLAWALMGFSRLDADGSVLCIWDVATDDTVTMINGDRINTTIMDRHLTEVINTYNRTRRPPTIDQTSTRLGPIAHERIRKGIPLPFAINRACTFLGTRGQIQNQIFASLPRPETPHTTLFINRHNASVRAGTNDPATYPLELNDLVNKQMLSLIINGFELPTNN